MKIIEYLMDYTEEIKKETEENKKKTEILNKIGEKQVALIAELEKIVRNQPKIDQLKVEIAQLENTR